MTPMPCTRSRLHLLRRLGPLECSGPAKDTMTLGQKKISWAGHWTQWRRVLAKLTSIRDNSPCYFLACELQWKPAAWWIPRRSDLVLGKVPSYTIEYILLATVSSSLHTFVRCFILNYTWMCLRCIVQLFSSELEAVVHAKVWGIYCMCNRGDGKINELSNKFFRSCTRAMSHFTPRLTLLNS